ncbi:MAG: hypothetical protein F4123_08795 [Gemmatimonadetes bacterium]|nr:hypothetical protein [Gemmatimonadota bacterium]MYB97163.1 hypothetical protein [Gemmatimonadota bacterium]MYI46451.1 hypothetical protein [Gemmatimonadota bacterium]
MYRARQVARTISAGGWLRLWGPIAGCCAGLLAIAASACEGADQDPPEVESPIASEIHDSAGIPIVENRAPAPDSRLGWAVGDAPVVAGVHGRTMTLRGPLDPATREVAAAGQAADGAPADVEPHVVLRVLPGGAMLTRTPRGFRQGFHRWESSYALMGTHGATRASLGNYLGIETFSAFYQQPDGNFAVIPLRHPFGKTTVTTAWGDLAAIGDTETYEIRGYRSDGSLARIVRRDHETRIPTQAEQDQVFRNRFAGLSEEDREPRMAVAADVPLAESFPAYSRIRGDALGNLWVAEFKLPDARYEGTLWTVFDREGRALGFVATPGGLSIFEIGEDYILGSTTDEMDVEYVEMWELARSD